MRIEITGTIPKVFGLSKSELKAAATYFAQRSQNRLSRLSSSSRPSQPSQLSQPSQPSRHPPWHEVVVNIVRDAESDECHQAIMGVEGATDVITQAYDAIPPEEPGLYGELIVNTDQAQRAAPQRKGWSPVDELLLYVAHGMDHLSGADDHSEEDYRRMRRRELGWLKDFKRSLKT